MPHPTRLFESYADWMIAGRPIGGVFPATVDDIVGTAKQGGVPGRYQGRAMYYVALPNADETAAVQLWCPWFKAFKAEEGYHGEGWEILGPPDRMTVKPSIQTASWHGYLTDGFLERC